MLGRAILSTTDLRAGKNSPWKSCNPVAEKGRCRLASTKFTNVVKVLHKRNICCPLAEAPIGPRLTQAFFARSVHKVAPDLIGTTFLVNGVGGPIVEVEAYHHTDPAAHSYGGRTDRNAVMFGPPGFVYVYRSYGIHWCVNFVCEAQGSASAVLIRALMPTEGLAAMRRRRKVADDRLLCSGPGRLCQALAITHAHNALALDRAPFGLFARTVPLEVAAGPRIGITKAIDLPWRYALAGSRYLSRPIKSAT